MIYGVFHGDLHGGNLVVQPDGRTALFDFGMTGRLDRAAAARVPAAPDVRHHRATSAGSWWRCATSARSRPTSTSTRWRATSSSTVR